MLATQELRKRQRQHARQRGLSAKAIGNFLQSLEAQEILLTQRLRDLQARATRPESEQGATTRRRRNTIPTLLGCNAFAKLCCGTY
jgi:putative transposase